MAKGHALLAGLKSVDPASYNGWDGTGGCWGCELDVDNMERILKSLGYDTKVLKTADATRNSVLSSLYRAADNLVGDDIFVFYYSGHGGQQPDLNGDELDGKDETLVAYDREVIDDKIHYALTRFKTGVRIVMISDSCNSGSGTNYRGRMTVPVNEQAIFRPVARTPREEPDIKAQLIHMGGCRDGFSSSGYQHGGAFTIALCEAWQDGAFAGTFKDLYKKICELIRSSQKPQYNEYGPVTDEFRLQKAFTVTFTPPVDGSVELPVIDFAPYKAEIAHPGQKNHYKFMVEKGGRYTVDTEGRTDLVMALYGPDSETKLIARDDDSGTGINPKIATDLSPGTYYIRVEHYNSQTGTGAYTIKVVK
ncbi:MAG: caspase family protein [Deltaproteobacteria bacterium]|nr:caspase family protein [Deltaproteobacteria bacterium]